MDTEGGRMMGHGNFQGSHDGGEAMRVRNERVAELRAQGLMLWQIAERMGMSAPHVSNILKGRRGAL